MEAPRSLETNKLPKRLNKKPENMDEAIEILDKIADHGERRVERLVSSAPKRIKEKIDAVEKGLEVTAQTELFSIRQHFAQYSNLYLAGVAAAIILGAGIYGVRSRRKGHKLSHSATGKKDNRRGHRI